MGDQPQAQGGNLKQLAAKFGKLSDAENLLLEKIPTGDTAVCGPNDNDKDKANDPKDADHWGLKRRIRAELLAWLCTNEQARKHIHPRGIQVYGADVTGPLYLSFVNVPFQLALNNCRLKEDIELSRAEVSQLDFIGSLVNGIGADNIVVKNNVFLRNGFTANGEVRLVGAQVGGDLDCEGGNFTNKGGNALRADGINVKGGIFLRDGFTAQGEVRLLNARVGGDLDCEGGNFTNKGGYSLNVDGINVKGNVFLRNGFTANGEVRLPEAQIGGELDCAGGTFTNEGGYALNAQRLSVKGYTILRGSTAVGCVWLPGAQVGGDLDCGGGTFTNEGGDALNASEINVKGSVFLNQAKDAEGKETPFRAKSKVNLDGAEIDGMLSCSGGMFSNPDGDALSAERAIVKSSVFFSNGFSAEGGVDLEGAQIGGPLVCRGGHFENASLDLTDASVGTLWDSGLNDIPASSPADSPPTKWPQPGKLLLDGFNYGRISSDGKINVDKRLDWLALQPQSPFHPGPYLQLAKILRESGNDDGSKRVLIEMEDRLRRGDTFGPVMRPLLRLTVGYGYDPLRAFWWAAGLSTLGWIIYRRSYLAGGMVPTDKDACAEFREQERKLPAQYPSFSPLIYSVENSLPLVKLGQGDKWQPDPEPDPEKNRSIPKLGHRGTWPWSWRKSATGSAVSDETGDLPKLPPTETVEAQEAGPLSAGTGAAAAAAPARAPEPKPSPREQSSPIERVLIAIGLRPATDPKHVPSFLSRFGTSPRFVTWFLWFQILLGWLLATLFIAGVSGIVHKE